LLVKETLKDGSKRNVLLEVGVGAFFEPKLKERFGIVETNHVLLDSLSDVGLLHTDIDIIILSHLHFDHIGGLLTQYQDNKEPELLFPNAKILVGKKAWERALNPHFRDRASFIAELMELLKIRKDVYFVDSHSHELLGDDYCFHISDGHTPGMMLTEISMPSGPVVFCADLIPGEPWVHLPITMGYDRFAEKLIDEKQALLNDMFERNGRLFFTHDAELACGLLSKNEKQRFYLSKSDNELNGTEL